MKPVALLTFSAFLAISSFAQESRNCSTFMLKNDSSLLVGHNLDESPDLHIPGMVCINPRHVYREKGSLGLS